MNGRETEVSNEQAMREVQTLLDSWSAPEPSAWFDGRMAARLREEMSRPPQGFFARLRDRFLFSGNVATRPVLAGALAAVLLITGGSYAGLVAHHGVSPQTPVVSAAVEDLQIIDNNDQAIQQMDQLLDASDDDQPQS